MKLIISFVIFCIIQFLFLRLVFCHITQNICFKMYMRNAIELVFFEQTIYQIPRLLKLLCCPLDFAFNSLINYPGFLIFN